MERADLVAALTRPRPSGSREERQALEAMQTWCASRGIPFETHVFELRPYFNELVGAWLIGSRAALALAVARRWGWRALPLAAAAQIGGAADVAGVPLVTRAGARPAESLVITLGPERPERELILAAHYDSKTELLDHAGRRFFTSRIRLGSALTAAAGLLAAGEDAARRRGSRLAPWLHGAAVACGVVTLALAGGLGLNLALGRLVAPSSGAVDDGGACLALLDLAERLAAREVSLRRTRVTIAIFGGEEVNMQGSAAYVRERFPQPVARQWPALAVNLELIGQRGGYVVWERDGNALRTLPAAPEALALLRGAVQAVTGTAPRSEPLINSDGYSFLAAGVACAVLGSRDPVQGTGGLHRPTDSPGRVDPAKVAEATEVLVEVVRRYG